MISVSWFSEFAGQVDICGLSTHQLAEMFLRTLILGQNSLADGLFAFGDDAGFNLFLKAVNDLGNGQLKGDSWRR
jgi:hypothetical protein